MRGDASGPWICARAPGGEEGAFGLIGRPQGGGGIWPIKPGGLRGEESSGPGVTAIAATPVI